MKKSLMLVAGAAMALAGCSKSDVAGEVRPEGAKAVRTFAAEIASSRTTLNDAATRLKWAAGDRLGFYSDVETDLNIGSSTYAEGDTNFTAEIDTRATAVYAYYPYNAGQVTSYGYTSVNLPIEQTQTQAQAGVLAGEYVPMSATAPLVEGEQTVLSFTPVASLIAFDLYDAEDNGDKVKSVTFAPAGTKLNGNRYVDMTTGAATSSSPDGYYTSATVTLTTPYAVPAAKAADRAGYIYLAVTPKNYENGGTFTVTTEDNATYIFTTDKPIDLSNVYAPAVLTMNLAKVRKPVKDFSGSYVVLVNGGSGYYALSSVSEEGKTRLLAVGFEYNGDESIICSDASLVWTVAKSGSNYTFANGGKYLAWTDTGNSSDTTDEPHDMTIVEQGDGVVFIHPANAQGRYLAKNNSGDFFAFYGNTGQHNDLYLIPAVYKLMPTIELGEYDASVELAFDDENDHEITVPISDATTVEVKACDDEAGETEAEWLIVSYDKESGKLSYMADTNTAKTARTAYIIISATNKNGTTTAMITVLQSYKGGVVYNLAYTFVAGGMSSAYEPATGVNPDNGISWTVTSGSGAYVGINSKNASKCKLGEEYVKVGEPMGYTADQTQVVAIITESAMANIGKVVVSGDTDSNNPDTISLVYSVDDQTYTLIGTQNYNQSGNTWEFDVIPSAYYAVVMEHGSISSSGYERTQNLKIEYYTGE